MFCWFSCWCIILFFCLFILFLLKLSPVGPSLRQKHLNLFCALFDHVSAPCLKKKKPSSHSSLRDVFAVSLRSSLAPVGSRYQATEMPPTPIEWGYFDFSLERCINSSLFIYLFILRAVFLCFIRRHIYLSKNMSFFLFFKITTIQQTE